MPVFEQANLQKVAYVALQHHRRGLLALGLETRIKTRTVACFDRVNVRRHGYCRWLAFDHPQLLTLMTYLGKRSCP